MKNNKINSIKSPGDIKKMTFSELEETCVEMREFLINEVPKTCLLYTSDAADE